jgi:hypothetical protein
VRVNPALVLAIVLSATPSQVRAQSTAALPQPADTVRTPTVRPDFSVIPRESYLRRHAFSLDHFFEFEPGGVLVRLGPIGNDAFYSRWGVGSGRALVLVNGIPLNDPQDGRAPLAHIATSGLSVLTMDASVPEGIAPSPDGSIVLHELEPLPSRPHTFVELSKGTNEVRQRRVRFGSQAGRVGLDLSYDEVLDDGYNFDANEVVFDGPVEGRALSRNAAIVVRGDLAVDSEYSIGLRRFRASSTGDLQSALNESSRSGHIAWATVHTGPARATVYGRGYSSDRPDSSTINESLGGLIAWSARNSAVSLTMFARGERTNARQTLNGATADTRVSTGTVGAGTEAMAAGFTWFADGAVSGDEKSWDWSGGAGVRRPVVYGDLGVSARRMIRLPSIGERYGPEHNLDGLRLSGNRGLEAESAWEGRAAWTVRAGAITNRASASWMRSEDYIVYGAGADSLSRLARNSEDQPTMTIIDERIGVAAMLGAIEVRADAGGYYSTGDRTGAFRSVPRVQVNAALELGRQLFEESSAVYVGGEYAFVDERADFNGVLLPSYNVVNLSLVGRLVDARVYVRWLNVLDAKYETASGYLMTPRTIAYGIEWTLFD